MNLATPEAWEDYDPEAERLHGPPNHLVRVHSERGGELLATESQLEEFERDTNTPLVSDTPPPKVWRRLCRWLRKNHNLQSTTHL